jgi:hypothetical protein
VSERLACRSCGIQSPDVGFTETGDLLCDDCESHAGRVLADLNWRGFLAERGRVMCDHGELPGRCEAWGCAHRKGA